MIGAISELDAPLTPRLKGLKGLNAYLSGVDYQMLQQEREQVLNAKNSDINALTGIVEAIASKGILCAIGNEGSIREADSIFNSIKELY